MANLANVIEQLRQNQIAGDEQSEATSGALQANTAALTAMGNTLTQIYSSISMLGIAVNSIASVITAQEDDDDDKAAIQRKEQKDKEDKEEQQNLFKRMMSGFARTMSSIKESITKVMPKTMGSALTGILGGLLLPLLSPAAGPAALAAGLATGNPALILAGAIATIITAVANSDEIKAAFEGFKTEVMRALNDAISYVRQKFIEGWEWLKTWYDENLAPYIEPYREGFMAIFGPIIDFFKENPDKLWYVGIAGALSLLLGRGGLVDIAGALVSASRLLLTNPYVLGILGLVAGVVAFKKFAEDWLGLSDMSPEAYDAQTTLNRYGTGPRGRQSVESEFRERGIVGEEAIAAELERLRQVVATDEQQRESAAARQEYDQELQRMYSDSNIDTTTLNQLLPEGMVIDPETGQLRALHQTRNRRGQMITSAADQELRMNQRSALLDVIQRGGLAEGEMVSDVFGAGVTDMSSYVNNVIQETQNTAMLINNGIGSEDSTYSSPSEGQ